jgi:hypothetical protein
MRSVPFQSRAVTAPGAANSGDLPAISPVAGQAHGIVIDNPSGSWLTVYPIGDFVPPYTLQWTRDFPYSIASATVRYTNGPSDQPSSQEGEPMTVWLDSEPVGASNGIAAPGAAFRPLSTTTQDIMADGTYLGLPLALIPAQTGARARIYSFQIGYSPAVPIAPQPLDMPLFWRLQPDPFPVGGQSYAFGVISPQNGYQDRVSFDVNPRDVDISGFDVAITLNSLWATGVGTAEPILFRYHLRYSIV